MTLKTFINKVKGRWTQFSNSELGYKLITRTKSFVWRYGVFLLVTLLAYFSSQILPTIKMNPELVALIAYVCNEITKELNKK